MDYTSEIQTGSLTPNQEQIDNYIIIAIQKYSYDKLTAIIDLLYQRLTIKQNLIQSKLSKEIYANQIQNYSCFQSSIQNYYIFFDKYNKKFGAATKSPTNKIQKYEQYQCKLRVYDDSSKRRNNQLRGLQGRLNSNSITQDLIQNLQQKAQQLENYVLKDSLTIHQLQVSHQPPEFYNSAMKRKYYEKIVTARVFCEKGYGISNLRQVLRQKKYEISLEQPQKRYKTVCSGVVTEGFRRLQIFLKSCGYKIKQLNSNQIKPLYTYLLNCRQNLSKQMADTMVDFIRLNFNLSNISVIEGLSIRLYYTIIKHTIKTFYKKLSKQRIPKNPTSYFYDYNSTEIWTPKMQYQLLQEYIKLQKISKIRDVLKLRHGSKFQFLNINNIKNRFNKILRKTIRRLQRLNLQPNNCLPNLGWLSEDNICSILDSTEGLECRLLLCEISKDYQTIDYKLLFAVIIKIKQHLQDTELMLKTSPYCDPIFCY